MSLVFEQDGITHIAMMDAITSKEETALLKLA